MSDTNQESVGTKPVAEHEFLRRFMGEWTVESEMIMGPDQPPVAGSGRESCESLGGLWTFTQGEGTMPNGATMRYKCSIGYDVSFKEYRGCWIADVSSHLWTYTGTLSEDGNTLTLECVGPHMEKDGETANYRDVHHFEDADHRTLTSYGQDDEGNWHRFMTARYTRI